jgi:hypothetical protein
MVTNNAIDDTLDSFDLLPEKDPNEWERIVQFLFMESDSNYNIRPTDDNAISEVSNSKSSKASKASRTTSRTTSRKRSCSESDLVFCIVEDFLPEYAKGSCQKIMTQQKHIAHLNYPECKDSDKIHKCCDLYHRIKLIDKKVTPSMFRRKLFELKKMSTDELNNIKKAINEKKERISSNANQQIINEFATDIKNNNEEIIKATEGIQYLNQITQNGFIQITKIINEQDNEENTKPTKLIRLSSKQSSNKNNEYSIGSWETMKILSSVYSLDTDEVLCNNSFIKLSIF